MVRFCVSAQTTFLITLLMMRLCRLDSWNGQRRLTALRSLRRARLGEMESSRDVGRRRVCGIARLSGCVRPPGHSHGRPQTIGPARVGTWCDADRLLAREASNGAMVRADEERSAPAPTHCLGCDAVWARLRPHRLDCQRLAGLWYWNEAVPQRFGWCRRPGRGRAR